MKSDRGATIAHLAARPRGDKPIQGIVFYLPDGRSMTETANRTLRTVASDNLIAITPKLDSFGLSGLAEALVALNAIRNHPDLSHLPLHLVGHGDGARLCFALNGLARSSKATQISSITSIAGPSEWPFEKLSPKFYIDAVACPVLILHGARDNLVASSEADALEGLLRSRGHSPEKRIIEGASHAFGEKWGAVLETALAFIAEHGQPS